MTWSESSQPLLVKEGEGKDSRFKRFRAVSDLFRTSKFWAILNLKVSKSEKVERRKVKEEKVMRQA